jgi:hypothetical protein
MMIAFLAPQETPPASVERVLLSSLVEEETSPLGADILLRADARCDSPTEKFDTPRNGSQIRRGRRVNRHPPAPRGPLPRFVSCNPTSHNSTAMAARIALSAP